MDFVKAWRGPLTALAVVAVVLVALVVAEQGESAWGGWDTVGWIVKGTVALVIVGGVVTRGVKSLRTPKAE